MRGDVVYRVYGQHDGRAQDVFFGAFRTRKQAEAEVAKLAAREMHGRSWAAQYHDRGFAIREVVVEIDFEFPSLPKPRDRYILSCRAKPHAPGTWDSTIVEVRRRDAPELLCSYERTHAMFHTFEPFRQGDRELALISRDYTRTAVLDLASGKVIAEEPENGEGFCPVGFYVADWWDVNDASIVPGSEFWDDDLEWPTGDFGFVWGCVWGDDSSWKVQHLDLRRVQEGVITRDERFGYVELVTRGYLPPCLDPAASVPSAPPPFIELNRHKGVVSVRFFVDIRFDLASGKPRGWQRVESDEVR